MIPHNMSSQMVSPIDEVGHHDSFVPRNRRLSSTGGNRSWSEEEENYLLQTRMQKMPYKHIAAHLKKTELACRLHYHQLSHGSHRRKRTSSVSSSHSSGSTGQSPHIAQYHISSLTEDGIAGLNRHSRHNSPNSYTPRSPPDCNAHTISPARPGTNQSYVQPNPQKVLLPRPANANIRSGSPEQQGGLRINTNAHYVTQSSNAMHPPSVLSNTATVDTERLRAIYEARRQSFWESIAAEYGPNVSPAMLEEVWRTGGASIVRPPTPGGSPDGSVFAMPTMPQLQLTMNGLRPSPFAPSYPAVSSSAVELTGRKTFSPLQPTPVACSAVSAPERMQYILPTPTCSSAATSSAGYGTPAIGGFSRSSPWCSRDALQVSVPATAISALLTENKSPRRECLDAGKEDVAMIDVCAR